MRILKFWCWFRDYHQFPMPPGKDDEAYVVVDEMKCRTCGQDFLELIAWHNDMTRVEARRYFTSGILTRS